MLLGQPGKTPWFRVLDPRTLKVCKILAFMAVTMGLGL